MQIRKLFTVRNKITTKKNYAKLFCKMLFDHEITPRDSARNLGVVFLGTV